MKLLMDKLTIVHYYTLDHWHHRCEWPGAKGYSWQRILNISVWRLQRLQTAKSGC